MTTTRTRGINLNIRLTDAESASFRIAAATAGLDQSSWIRMLCRQAAGMVTTTTQAEEKPTPTKKTVKKAPAKKPTPTKKTVKKQSPAVKRRRLKKR